MRSAVILLIAVVMVAALHVPAFAAKSEPDVPHAELLKIALKGAGLSGKTIVETFVLADTAHWVRDDLHLLPGDIRVLGTKTVSGSWRRRLTRLLLRDSLFTGLATLDPAEEGPHVAVRFDDWVGALEVRMYFPSRRAQIILGGSPLGVVRMAPVVEDALALVREAFPHDTTWATMPEPVPARWWGHPSLYLSDTTGFALPEAIHKVAPEYPKPAVANGLQGVVWIRACISEQGRVRDAYILRSIPMLDVAAIEAIRQWSFAPARFDGQPKAVWVQIPVRFKLN